MFDEELPPQKMLPSFRLSSMAQQIREASTSIRRWWWEYLRLSKDYWLLCQTCPEGQPETYDEALAKTFKDFGNVHEGTFGDWWRRTGSALFAEQQLPPRVTKLSEVDGVITGDWSGKIVVEIPLQLTRETVQSQIDELLDSLTDRPARQMKVSTSRYPSYKTMPRLETLQKAHDAYCLHREFIAKPKALANLEIDDEESQTKADLFWIGTVANLNRTYSHLIGTEEKINEKKRHMRSLVGKTVLNASKIISHVEHGKFPCDHEIPEPKPRFSTKQKVVHAKLEEQWWSLDLHSDLSDAKFDKARS
jgi:hypothetical protein